MDKFKNFLLAAVALVFPTEVIADHLYEGDAFYANWQLFSAALGNIALGNGSGWFLELSTTGAFCVHSAAGRMACSTYREYGWY